MKKILLISIALFMIFFKNSLLANYEKKFFDFKIDSIDGEVINFKNYNELSN